MKRIILFVAFAAAPSAWANGFQINEQDARATGRADAVTASTSNASAIYYNPAGIANLEGFNANVGLTFIAPFESYKSPSGGVTNADNLTFFVPNVYATYRIIPLLSVGVGVAPSFGAGIKWPASSPGRSVLRQQTLQSFGISAVVGLDFSEWVDGLRVGGGIDLVPASVYLAQDILFGTDVASLALSGSAFGVGGRVGVQYAPKVIPLSFGVSYRAPVALNFKGNANFTAPPVYRGALPPDGAGSTSLTLPQGLNAGVAWHIVDSLELEIDFSWTNWASFQNLAVTLPGNQTQVQTKNWKDSFAGRLGLEWSVIEALQLRAGVSVETSPVPASTLSFDLPDAFRTVASLGVGYQFIRQLRADVGVMYVIPSTRNTGVDLYAPPIKGSFTTSGVVAALSLGLRI